MTVSIKRWIAIVAMIAMTLAGTPIETVANDGLDGHRYGFSSKSSDKQATIADARSDFGHNPFRASTVSAATIVAGATVERAPKLAASEAKIIWANELQLDSPAKVQVAVRQGGQLVTPNFGALESPSLFESFQNAKDLVNESIAQSLHSGWQWLQSAEPVSAEPTAVANAPKKIKASTASFRIPVKDSPSPFKAAKSTSSFSSFSTMTTRKASIVEELESVLGKADKDLQHRIAAKRLARGLGAGNTVIMNLPVVEQESGFDIYSAVNQSICSVANWDFCEPAQVWLLDASEYQTFQAEVAEEDIHEGIENKLLMDSFTPNTRETFEHNPAKLSVPAILINDSPLAEYQTLGMSVKVNSVFNSAKILFKSVIRVVGPVSGIQKAFDFSRQWHSPMFPWDKLNWCTWHI